MRNLLGKAVYHQQRGDYADAERIYAQIIASDPAQPDAHNFMGLLAYQTGRHALAESHLQRSIEIAPQRAEFYYNFGGVLANLGKLQPAAQAFQSAVDIDPGMIPAWQGLGSALHEMKLDMHAISCFQRVLAAEPGRADIWRILGECFQAVSMLPEAIDAYKQARRLSPRDAGIQSALAGAAIDNGDADEARIELERLVEIAPTMPESHYQHGMWLASTGQFNEARAELELALELAPDFYQAALYYAYITPMSPQAPLAVRLQDTASRATWRDPGQGANIHYTLGYILDKDGQQDAAFRHYLEATRLQRQLDRYSTESQVEFQRSMFRAFDASFLARGRGFGHPSSRPIFIVGMPRSGTSLLEQMLAAHPEVHGGGEMLFLHAELRRRLGPAGYTDMGRALNALPDAELADIGAALVRHLDMLAPQKRHVTDKMPSNFMLLGLIHALLPHARIIHCRRDPLDTCVSCFTTSFRQGHKFSNDLRELGEYYRLYEETMERWTQMLPPRTIHEIRYEDLVNDPKTELTRILSACDLPWDDACLEFQNTKRVVNTASVLQVRQPLYKSGIGRWRRYEAHLMPLKQALAGPPLL